MNKISSHTLSVRTASGLGVCIALVSTPVMALDAGDIVVRVGIGHVSPNEESNADTVLGAGSKIGIDSDSSLAMTLAYMVTPNIGVELLGALPFNHDISLNGTKIAETDHLPPTVVAQYYFKSDGGFRPYVGVGVNFTTFFNTKTTGPLTGAKLSLDDSWGLAGQVGLDIDVGNNWLVNAAVWYMDIDTTATLNHATDIDIQIDPWAAFVGVGYKF